MPRGKTKSKLTLSERREAAFRLFLRGFTNAQVARQLGVTDDTVTNYRRIYEDRIAAEAAHNPALLRDVLANTIRAMEELEEVRREAWASLNAEHSCEECNCHLMSHQSRNQYLSTLLKAQEQRGKLFGLFGVKQEFAVMVFNVKAAQDKILEFLARNLCPTDRSAFQRFLDGPEMQAYANSAGPIETTALERTGT